LGVAFDEALADRIRDALAPRGGLSERRMFGGIAFMLEVAPEATAEDEHLGAWVDAGADFAASLPSK